MSASATAPRRSMLPREHGAWGLLLQPFVAGAVLGGAPASLFASAAVLLLAGFALRNPLLELVRARLQRRAGAGELRTPLLWSACEAALLAAALWRLWPRLAPAWRLGLCVVGAAFTLLAVWIGWRNWQRSRLFQTASAAVLALSAPFALHLGQGSVPVWGWMLWLVFALHGAVAIQLVHERLERRAAARAAESAAPDSTAFLGAVCAQLAAGLALSAADWRWLLPPLFSSVYALAEWRTLRRSETLREPLARVGWRTLSLSVLHLAISIAAFWQAARIQPPETH